MITLEEALEIVLDSARPLASERVNLDEAFGRILAEDVVADMDMPPFDKAAMDGYACRRADLANRLTVIGTIPAGTAPAVVVGPGQCAKIMTGAPVPQGADCVVMIEQTETVGDSLVRFTSAQTPDHICRKAEDIRAGQVVLSRGTRIGPPHIAVLASVGHTRPLAAGKPRVGVIASGDELVPPAARPGLSQIRNSNSAQLVAQLRTLGAAARDCGIVRDVAADIDATLKAAFAENDVVIVSGGVSAGDFDFVPAVLRRNGVLLRFEKIAVKPGKPTVFGVSQRGYCFGLPGNPVSTFVVFELLVKPFLYRLMGHDYTPVEVQMSLAETIARRNKDRQSWMPVEFTSRTTVRPVNYHGSAHVLAFCAADGLIRMEIGVDRLEQGAAVDVRLVEKAGL